MAHIGAERLGIDTGGDHQARVGMAALVETETRKPHRTPNPADGAKLVGGIERAQSIPREDHVVCGGIWSSTASRLP